MSFLSKLFRRNPHRMAGHRLYLAAAAQSRSPALYERYLVPDTLDGRFDSLVLHVFLILHRLRSQGEEALELSHEVVNTLVADMDRTLREMGIADVGVAKRVKKMVQAFYGRIGAYDAGLAAADDSLLQGLVRNVYRGEAPAAEAVEAFAAYVRVQVAHLDALPLEAYMQGEADFVDEFPSPPAGTPD
jgi:cytochrome b pre-mRNA-processing protein 3